MAGGTKRNLLPSRGTWADSVTALLAKQSVTAKDEWLLHTKERKKRGHAKTEDGTKDLTPRRKDAKIGTEGDIAR